MSGLYISGPSHYWTWPRVGVVGVVLVVAVGAAIAVAYAWRWL